MGNAGLSLSTSSSSFGGTLNSTGTVDLTVNGAYDNILALGSLSIAGSFDPTTGVATSATSSLLNASSTIQAGANLSIDAASVTNRNDHLVLGTTTSTQALTDTVLKVRGTSPATALLDASTVGYVAHGNASSTTPTITVDLKQQAQQLASQPGLAYLGQLAQRNDVAWQQVQLASQSWDYHQSGLTGVGAAIVAVAVACATGGMGAGLVGATTTSTAAMANAAFTTLVT